MATEATYRQEIAEIRNQMSWMDEERRKTNRKLAEVEQQVELQRQEIAKRENRIRDLEQRLADANARMSRFTEYDNRFTQLKEELMGIIEQNSDRLRENIKEEERLRRVEHEIQTREIATIRKDLPAISRLQTDMELRQAEEARLSHLIGTALNQLSQIEPRFDPLISELTYLNENSKRHTQSLHNLEAQILELSKKSEDYRPRIDLVADRVSHLDSDIRDFVKEQIDIRKTLKSWTEQIQLGEYERNNRLNTWERYFEEQQNVMNDYSKNWVQFSEQIQSAKMTIQQLEAWREQQETQIRDQRDAVKMEVNRVMAQWQTYQDENDKKWRHTESDREQRLTIQQRHERQVDEHLARIDDELEKITQDKDMLWRVQTAQADALKQFPRVWLEEVERTLEQNPYRRRQPTTVPTRKDLL